MLCCARLAKGQDGDIGNRLKHGGVAFALSGGIAYACRKNITLTDGSSNQYGCMWMGFMPVFIGGAVFEAMQNDLTDASGDIVANGIGALVGAITVNYILPASWFDKKGADLTINGPMSVQFVYRLY
jgi:hypothetical protein